MHALVALLLLADPTTVVLVRHAEKAAEPKADPPLTEAGTKRAALLPDALGGLKPVAVLSTNYERTRSTAAPVAARFKLKTELVEGKPPDVAAQVLKTYRGKTVLVVGHSNTVPGIVAALGAPEPKAICDGEFDRLFVVKVPEKGAATVEERKYGGPNADAGCP